MNPLRYYYSPSYEKGHTVGMHSHDCYELVYYKSCEGNSRIGGTDYPFFNNTFALLPPGCPHDETHLQRGSLSYIWFQASDISLPQGIYKDDPYRTVGALLARILYEGAHRREDSDHLLTLLIETLTVYLNRFSSPANVHVSGGVCYAKRFIDENYNWKIDLATLAKSCGLSFDSFRYSFKKEYGESPKSYLISRRLQKARQMLENGEQTCTQVAFACGFSDAAQFSTMFRQKYGVSPKAFSLAQKNTENHT